MNKKNFLGIFTIITTIISLIPIGNVYALSTTVEAVMSAKTKTTAQDKMAQRIETGKDRAGKEIDRRVTALSALSNKVNTLAKLSTEQKAGLTTSSSAR